MYVLLTYTIFFHLYVPCWLQNLAHPCLSSLLYTCFPVYLFYPHRIDRIRSSVRAVNTTTSPYKITLSLVLPAWTRLSQMSLQGTGTSESKTSSQGTNQAAKLIMPYVTCITTISSLYFFFFVFCLSRKLAGQSCYILFDTAVLHKTRLLIQGAEQPRHNVVNWTQFGY